MQLNSNCQDLNTSNRGPGRGWIYMPIPLVRICAYITALDVYIHRNCTMLLQAAAIAIYILYICMYNSAGNLRMQV